MINMCVHVDKTNVSYQIVNVFKINIVDVKFNAHSVMPFVCTISIYKL